MKTLMGKWEILPMDNPTVLRRLVKELNYRPAGFYLGGDRFNQARLCKGQLQVRMGRDPWTDALNDSVFGDGNGGTVCASRTRCGH